MILGAMTLASVPVNWMAFFPQAATFLFLGVFLSVLWRVLRAPKQEMNSYANMPLNETNKSKESSKDEQGDA